MRLTGSLLVIALSLFSCTEEPATPFNWLEGTWESADGSFSEIWTLKGESLEGIGFALDGTDTVFAENLSIEEVDGNWSYCAQVNNQNDGQRIVFPADSIADNYAHFVNEAHDFPRVIIYKMEGSTLFISLQGVEDSEPRKEELKLTKAE